MVRGTSRPVREGKYPDFTGLRRVGGYLGPPVGVACTEEQIGQARQGSGAILPRTQEAGTGRRNASAFCLSIQITPVLTKLGTGA